MSTPLEQTSEVAKKTASDESHSATATKEALAQVPPRLINEKLPREVRDKIYDIVIKDELYLGTRKTASDGTWRLTYFHRRPESSWSREEFLERMYARLAFRIRIFDYQNADFLGVPSPFPYIELSRIQDLILELWLEPAHEHSFEVKGHDGFIREPFSLNYDASGSLKGATLERSESTTSPTTYFDLQKHGIYSDHALPALVDAEKNTALPTRHNSKFGEALHKLLVALGERNELLSLDLRIVLPFRGRRSNGENAPAPQINSSSGVNEFLRPLELLHGMKNVKISVKRSNELYERGQDLATFLRQDAERLMVLLKSDRKGCSLSLDKICHCEECFPSLGGKYRQPEAATKSGPEDEYDEFLVKSHLRDVEFKKRDLSDRDESSTLPDRGDFPVGYEEHASAGNPYFCVGVQEHDADNWQCDCPACCIEHSKW
ncbi:hypothetical protein BC567DRAFT_265380 [Phyllosticta citribraziliensis]